MAKKNKIRVFDKSEMRVIEGKIKYNQKQIREAEKNGDDKQLINKYKQNIEHYQKQLELLSESGVS